MYRVISGFAFKMLFNLFNHGEDNHILNSDLKKAETHESIFMVSTGTVTEFQDRQAGSNSLSFCPLTSVKDPSLCCTPGLLFHRCNTLHLSLLDFVMHSCSPDVSYSWYLLDMILVLFIKTVKGLNKRNVDLKAGEEITKYAYVWRSPKMWLDYIQISWLNVSVLVKGIVLLFTLCTLKHEKGLEGLPDHMASSFNSLIQSVHGVLLPRAWKKGQKQNRKKKR